MSGVLFADVEARAELRGIERGLKRGAEQGEARGKAKSLLRVLCRRFPQMPYTFGVRFLEIDDSKLLDQLLDVSVDCTDLWQFESAYNEMCKKNDRE